MRTPTKIAVAAAAVLALVLAIVLGVGRDDDDGGPAAVDTPEEASTLVRDDSRIMGEEGTGGVTMVEFLDFECEACRAAFPIVEDLREKYAGRVTFVARYFPLPGHFNSERAARAVESAARQDKFDEMYKMMYETQAEWGEQRVPLDDLFRTFAEEIGLDMATFDADYASQEVADRVARDVEDGRNLGVQGTPTFYINGEPFEPQTVADFDTALDAALDE